MTNTASNNGMPFSGNTEEDKEHGTAEVKANMVKRVPSD